MKYQEPALGIMPKEIWRRQFDDGCIIPFNEITKRYVELCNTFERRIGNGDSLDIEWLKEYNEIIKTFN